MDYPRGSVASFPVFFHFLYQNAQSMHWITTMLSFKILFWNFNAYVYAFNSFNNQLNCRNWVSDLNFLGHEQEMYFTLSPNHSEHQKKKKIGALWFLKNGTQNSQCFWFRTLKISLQFLFPGSKCAGVFRLKHDGVIFYDNRSWTCFLKILLSIDERQ